MANFNLNRVILGGRLTADPELRMTQTNTPVTSFTLAVNRHYQSKNQDAQQADFIRCTAWRNQAEFISRYFRRGSSICIEGSIQTRSWTDQQGQKQFSTEVQVDNVYFVDAKGEGGAAPSSYTPDSYGAPTYTGGGSSAPKFEEISDDDDLPF